MAIFSGLNASSVQRLKDTWFELHLQHWKRLNELETLMSMDGNYREYREVLASRTAPCVPFLGMLCVRVRERESQLASDWLLIPEYCSGAPT